MANPLRRILDRWRARRADREAQALMEVKARYHAFRVFLENNGRALELVIDTDRALARRDDRELSAITEGLLSVTGELVDGLNLLSADAHEALYELHGRMASAVNEGLGSLALLPESVPPCLFLDEIGPSDHRLAGSKAANLAMLRRMGLPVPGAFVCTVRACRLFLEEGGIDAGIRRALRDAELGRTGLGDAAEAIRGMILAAPLPSGLERALVECRSRLTADGRGAAVSVRSSGVAEDGAAHSFAGQYTSVLNVEGDGALLDAFREVVASGFSARVMSYRQRIGMDPAVFDLAVLVQRMVPARAAGVLMTRDPGRPSGGRMLISAVSGLGTMAVGGAAPADVYRPLRADAGQGPENVSGDVETVIASKTVREVADGSGGLREEPVPESERGKALLSPEQVARLARYGEMVESLNGMSQDIEWALDEDGELHLLQARPLRVAAGGTAPAGALATPLVNGMCASAGKAVGQVLAVRTAAELDAAVAAMSADEEGMRILVLPQSIVEASPHLPRFAGLVVEAGNPADHLSCIARECALPMITGAVDASGRLAPLQWVVLDADNGQVLEASAELWAASRPLGTRPRPAQTAEARCVLDPPREELRKLIVPLNLTDAYGPTFSLAQCRSFHDLIRYTHEMAVLAMFHAGDMVMEEAGGLLHPLDIGVPFHFLVVDVGGGVRREATPAGTLRRSVRQRVLGPDDILSRPLAAVCEGLTTPGLSWHVGPDGAALSGLFSRNMLDACSARPAGSFNYALAARDYLNLNSRVEYHFAMLDAVCGGSAQANYVRFRFKGGGSSAGRTNRRARFLREVLEGNGFVTSVKGDLVTASLTGAGRDTVRARLVMLGRLIGFSRCLDAVMRDDRTASLLAQGFLAGNYDSERILEGAAQPAQA